MIETFLLMATEGGFQVRPDDEAPLILKGIPHITPRTPSHVMPISCRLSKNSWVSLSYARRGESQSLCCPDWLFGSSLPRAQFVVLNDGKRGSFCSRYSYRNDAISSCEGLAFFLYISFFPTNTADIMHQAANNRLQAPDVGD